MNKSVSTPSLAQRLTPFRHRRGEALASLGGFAVDAGRIQVLEGPAAFRQQLIDAIGRAHRRIIIVALYLENDEAGREVMQALHAARIANPQLGIDVFVDGHRARRGLLGHGQSAGNAAMYREYAQRFGEGVRVWGVPVQNRELFGVLHLKGMVIDDTVIYSGASLNNVYLHRHERYRLDRYHLIDSAALADSLAWFAFTNLRDNAAVVRLDQPDPPPFRERPQAIRDLRQQLRSAHYTVAGQRLAAGEVSVTPLAGFGRKDNALNAVILDLVRCARQHIVLMTPYFNLPRPVRVALGQALRRGCRIDMMVGDKCANDFYIPPDQPFKKIGLLPYLYEANLRRFVSTHKRHLARGQLNLWLWRHEANSFHLKGMLVDDTHALLTGNNLNPRAWALDLENGLLIRDPHQLLRERHQAEWERLRQHATRLVDTHDLQNPRSYPPSARKLLKRIRRFRFHHLLNRLL
ncbi:CDP-diacylglycerol--serine O-phosphatidyltransferase [Oleiagrimonas sp. C23AA]|uniref:CDP-diacylglycerol--serine O-phosphatidyltransferase n=1 Tax=Oleiagrimonas sp. C23AA TaxID=2719047 RepID=UPI001423368B|nr:CDP-diacylglycerol--serine O-phosphatidyltransferase [Oleiagrimonas sp. C23AA]NII09578.1 CDP-diacylglycerol--serine O-phosphatidyltransferase [Oleiagrimonas sp. C23AA]